jgi:hypothetical protein
VEDFTSGCAEEVPVLPDVSQHILFAQQPGWHAFWLATVATTHDRAASGIAAIGSITAAARDIVILLNTTPAS